MIVHGRLLCTLLARVRRAGKRSAAVPEDTAAFFLLFLVFAMAGAHGIARALNAWREEGLDMMGGADGAALDQLISDFMGDGGNKAEPSSNCNSTGSFNS